MVSNRESDYNRSWVGGVNSPSDRLAEAARLVESFSDAERNALRSALANSGPRSEIVEQIVEILPEVNHVQAANLIEALVISSLSDPGRLGPLEVSPKQDGWLRDLSEAPAIERLAYAAELAFETERQYVSSRVVTDVRPIFSPANGDTPRLTSHVLLMNTLSIDYTVNGGADASLWVSMTAADLRSLKSNIDRALMKLQILAESMPWGSVDLSDGK